MIIIVSYMLIIMLSVHIVFYCASAYYVYKNHKHSPAQLPLIQMSVSALSAILYWYFTARPFLFPNIRFVVPAFMCISMLLSYNAHKSLFDGRNYAVYRERISIQTLIIILVCFLLGFFKDPQTFVIDVDGRLPEWNSASLQIVCYYLQNLIYILAMQYLCVHLIIMFKSRLFSINNRTMQIRILGAIVAWLVTLLALMFVAIDLILAALIGDKYHYAINNVSLALICITSILFMSNTIPQRILEFIAYPIDEFIRGKRLREDRELGDLNRILEKITPNILRVPEASKYTLTIEINDSRDIIWTNIPREREDIKPEVEASFIVYCFKNDVVIQKNGKFPALDSKCANRKHILSVQRVVKRLLAKSISVNSGVIPRKRTL